MKRSHEEIKELLIKNSVPLPPADLGELVDVRYHMGSESWYVSMGAWKVYWFSGKEWKHCRMKKDVHDD